MLHSDYRFVWCLNLDSSSSRSKCGAWEGWRR